MRLTLYKYHGQNKDYLVYDTIQNHKKLNESMIRMLCDRNRGLGSDGLITGPFLEDDTIGVQVYGPDGSEKIMYSISQSEWNVPERGRNETKYS